MSLRVGIVAYELEGRPTGVGRYLKELLKAALPIARDWTWVLFFPGSPSSKKIIESDRLEEDYSDSRMSPVLWEQLILPSRIRRHSLDLLFSPSYSLPGAIGLPSVVTIHDLSFEKLPEEFGLRQRWRRRLLARRSCRLANRVLTVSRQTKAELIELYSLSPDKISITANGVALGLDPNLAVRDSDLVGELDHIGVRKPYFLYLGTILERRNVDLMIRAFSRLSTSHQQHSLVIAGANRLRHPKKLQTWLGNEGITDRTVLLGYVDEEMVPILYRQADLTYYLSTYEGFGIPPLESLASGTPAIVGNCPAIQEYWQDYPYQCQPQSLQSILAITQKALTDQRTYQDTATRGVDFAGQFTWQKSAEKMLAIFEKISTESQR